MTNDGSADLAAPSSPLQVRREIWPYALIGGVPALLLVAFAWSAGWLPGSRLSATKMLDAIEANGVHRGYRRAHSRGVCIAGYFDSNGAGERLSIASVLAPGRTPFVGRMSIGGADPAGREPMARVRSMALELTQSDRQQWRMAMNSFPVNSVATPEAFYEQTLAARPDPATGKPDPAKLAAFDAAHPESAPFKEWARTSPFTDSFANTAYHSVHAFLFDDGKGHTHAVRWSMQPLTPVSALSAETRSGLPADYLERELGGRLGAGPVRWSMAVTLAAPEDNTADPTIAWPLERETVVVGEVVLESMHEQATGACRSINFDPLILPEGVRGSDDPILHARSAVYSVSAARRLRETAAHSHEGSVK